MNALEVRGLTKRFNGITAVNKADFEVPEGSIFGLLGRNGAGKTTTLRMLMDIYVPDEGEIIFRGNPVGQEFRDNVGYLPEERGLYKKMKVWDLLLFFAEVKGKTGKEIQSRAMDYLKRFDLYERRFSKIEDLSKGNQQKIQFIATVLHDPDFLVLDEPFSGLDPINTELLREIIIEKQKEGKVIIFSTHLMDYAEKMCSHIALINKGEIILKGSLSDIKKQYANSNVSLTYEGDISFLESEPFVEKITDFGNSTGIRVKSPSDTQTLLKSLVDNGVVVKKFDANDISLHEIFVELAGDGIEELKEVGHDK